MQIRLMQISRSLKKGQAINITKESMRDAAKGNLSSLLFDSVRPNDVKDLVAQIERNWGVTMTENIMTGNYTMFKLKEI